MESLPKKKATYPMCNIGSLIDRKIDRTISVLKTHINTIKTSSKTLKIIHHIQHATNTKNTNTALTATRARVPIAVSCSS